VEVRPFIVKAVTLLTDFGTVDGYVGAMKGVLAREVPGVLLHDIAHDIPRGDVYAAARALSRYWSLWPVGTVHLVVVDPGVGTGRRPLAMESEGRFFVGPDNGVATPLLHTRDWRAVCCSPEVPPGSTTFHGRDLFAPMGARLLAGTPLEALGPPLEEPHRLPWGTTPGPEGRIVGWDHFGNLQTDLEPVGGSPSAVTVEGITLPLVTTYGSVAPGEALALVNSDGCIEIAIREGSAREHFGWGHGTRVRMKGG
jgi:S-adenosyl-L-methionine hydrolase (adenosine-forming)